MTTLARTKSLSKQIRQAREVKGFTVAQLADRLGVSQVSIYYWESGRVRPRDTNFTALCKALKMPVRETMALRADNLTTRASTGNRPSARSLSSAQASAATGRSGHQRAAASVVGFAGFHPTAPSPF